MVNAWNMGNKTWYAGHTARRVWYTLCLCIRDQDCRGWELESTARHPSGPTNVGGQQKPATSLNLGVLYSPCVQARGAVTLLSVPFHVISHFYNHWKEFHLFWTLFPIISMLLIIIIKYFSKTHSNPFGDLFRLKILGCEAFQPISLSNCFNIL